jgi:hypothetical protein
VRLLAAALVLCLFGCEHASRPAGAPALRDTLVVISPEPDALPFDPRAERLRAATAELTRTAGHPVVFVVDAALAADSRGAFEREIVDAVETVARDLADLREREPAAFAHAVPLLDRIACRYRATARRPEAELDPIGRTLSIAQSSDGASLVPRGIVRAALEEAYARHARERYAAVSPRDVPPSERAAYFGFLDETRGLNADYTPHGISDKRGERILKMFALAAVAGNDDPALAKRVRTWLFDHRSYLTDAYVHHADAARAAPSGSAFRRAEAAYVSFLQRELPAMTDEEKLAVARDVFVRGFGGQGYLRWAFPGFDRLGFAFGVVDAWARAGHPDQAESARRNLLYEHIVCPHPVGPDGHRSLGPRCDHDMMRYALETDADTRRLVGAMVQRNDAVFTETVFVSIPYAVSAEPALGKALLLWRMVEPHEPSWRIAARVVADEMAGTADRAQLSDEVRRVWRAHPGRRGLLLYVMARADPYANGAVAWNDFERDFGDRATAVDFAAFLDQGPRAMSSAHTVWPALGPGWSRASIVVPRLDSFLADARAQAKLRAVMGIVKRLCDEGAAADLAQLHAYFVARVRAHPGESFSDAMEATAPGACKPAGSGARPALPLRAGEPVRAPRPAGKRRPTRGEVRDLWR